MVTTIVETATRIMPFFSMLLFFPIANSLPYLYNIHIPYIQMQHIKKGDFQWTLFQKFLRLSQATRGR